MKTVLASLADRDRQIKKLERHAARIETFLNENEPRIVTTGEVKSNITDNESAKMVTSHGTIQGYNGQALVDSKHQVILHGEAYGSGQDKDHLAPILDGAKENLKVLSQSEDYFKGKIFTAGTCYHRQTNLIGCEQESWMPSPRIGIFEKEPQIRNQGTASTQTKEELCEGDFRHDQGTDRYICPREMILRLQVKRWSGRGNIYRRYVAEAADCRSCPLIGKCIRRKNAKRKYLTVPIGAEPTNLTKKMIEKIESERGQKIYPQRMAIVEPVFGNIRTQKRTDRFTLRGKIKVPVQWLLYCMVHNVEKIATCGLTS